jgi:hypothetical protein
LTIAAPWPAEGQFSPCCAILAAGLSSISSALQSVIGGGLNQILGIDQSIQQFEQNIVWPQNLINQARSLVGSLQGIFNQIQTLTKIQVNSATLPNAQQLETNLLSRNANQIAHTSANYTALYGSVPAATDASQQVRDMVDMTDAAAQAAMKRAIERCPLRSGTSGRESDQSEHPECRARKCPNHRGTSRRVAGKGQCIYTGGDR